MTHSHEHPHAEDAPDLVVYPEADIPEPVVDDPEPRKAVADPWCYCPNYPAPHEPHDTEITDA